jgi:cobalt/nickel transport system permease protein
MRARILPHPRIRFVISFLMICIAVTSNEIPLILLNIIWGQALLFYFRVPVTFLWNKLKPLLFFILFMYAFFPLTEGVDGFFKAITYSGRLLFVSQMISFIFYQTSNQVLLLTLGQLKIPSIFIELIHFTLRFMDVFIVEAKRMKLSIKSKGFFVGSWFHIKKYQILGNLLGSLLRRCIQRSERIYLGMQSRGYTEHMITLEEEEIPTKWWLEALPWIMVMIFLNISYGIWGSNL